MENSDKLRRKPSKLGLAGAALLSLVGAEPSYAAQKKPLEASSAGIVQEGAKSDRIGQLNWFSQSLASLSKIKSTELQRMEQMIEDDSVPLSLQVNFLENTLKSGSIHYKELHDPRLTPERLSRIIKVVDYVSARLTIAYEKKNVPPGMEKYFNVDSIVNASHFMTIDMPAAQGQPETSVFSNGFLVRDGVDVYFATAKHSVAGTPAEPYYSVAKKGGDTAVRYISPSEYTRARIVDPRLLPSVESTTTMQGASGKVLVSVSWAVDHHHPQGSAPEHLKRSVHFSFAMPFTNVAKSLMVTEGNYTFNGEEMMFLKPHGEGHIVYAHGGGMTVRAGGTSGSAVGIMDDQYKILGNLTSVRQLDDSCIHVCYAAAFSSGPNSLPSAIEVERHSRTRASLK